MDVDVRERFDRLEAIMHAAVVRQNEIERRFDERHEKAMARMDRADDRMAKAEARMDRADARMDKFERNLEGMRKLLVTGIKMLTQTQAEIRDLKRAQKAFFESFRNGRNGGNGHKNR